MTQRVKDAIDVFLDAINNGTLAKGTCTACAVGNLVAHGMGGTISDDNGFFICDVGNYKWGRYFSTDNGFQNVINPNFEESDLLECVNATSFSLEELREIEYAFETNASIRHTNYHRFSKEDVKRDQINGLEAVIKVMLSFEEDTETNVKEVFTDKVLING
jgi:hypothetical protein